MSDFKKGQKVSYKTNRGRKGSGTVADVNHTAKGAWIVIKNPDDSTTACRPCNVKAA